MADAQRESGGGNGTQAYEEPRLVVHGTVQDLTAGTQGRVPDGATVGSYLPDDSAQS